MRLSYVQIGAVMIAIALLAVPATTSSVTLSDSVTVRGAASITGNVSATTKGFYIDHPLDPKNKILYHSNVESPDVKNFYDGIVALDATGRAIVELPDYFLALNKDFRYLATPIGEPMPNLYLSSEVDRRYFGLFGAIVLKISGGAAHGKVSWQVTGIRHDPYIMANPTIPEVEKSPTEFRDKGEYIFPAGYEIKK